uniref:NTP_transf_2 domain-containing protein n=1 Tax=Caenorhabditis tropicalis TaxID=1561998 RepID=A0A1I7TCA3_9PELO
MEHFPAICCFGGEPFLDFHTNSSIDPTDWSADLVKDPPSQDFLSALSKLGMSISQCQLFNITFNDVADQTMFDTYKASFQCR